MKKILIFCTFLIQALNAQNSPTSVGWAAFGNFRGHIESCGCDPATNLGGVKRLGTFLDEVRAQYQKVYVFDLGENVGLVDLQNKFIAKSLKLLKVDVALFSGNESVSLDDYPYVVSNSKSQGKIPNIRVFETLVVMGYQSTLETWGQRLGQKWRKILDPHSKRYKILLFSGNDADLTGIARSQMFDEIISTNTMKKDHYPDDSEKKDEKKLVRMISPQIVFMVPHGGLGVLRGGALKQSSSLMGLFTKTSKPDSLESVLSAIQDFSWLEVRYDQNSPLQDLMNEYNVLSSKNFQKLAEEKRKDIGASHYAGSATCQSCHPGAFKVWSDSKHAHAYETLKNVGKHQDASCIGCHVVGFDKPGGFVSEELTAHLKGVQCENCHGPRKEHIVDPDKNKGTTINLQHCQTCHHNPHSPSFETLGYWEKIKH